MPYACQATPEDLKKQKKACWNPNCHKRAWLEDWGGWKWCLKDWMRSLRDNEGFWNRWFFFRSTKLYWSF